MSAKERPPSGFGITGTRLSLMFVIILTHDKWVIFTVLELRRAKLPTWLEREWVVLFLRLHSLLSLSLCVLASDNVARINEVMCCSTLTSHLASLSSYGMPPSGPIFSNRLDLLKNYQD
jgi:hypothetical protein